MKKIIIGMLILSSLVLADKHSDKRADLYLKDGKYFSPDRNEIFTGSIIYSTQEDKIDYLEIIYRDGLISEEKEFYKSGALKKLIKYDEEEEPFLEETYYEDGTLAQRKLIKDGNEKIILIDSDDFHSGKNSYSPDGKFNRRLGLKGDIEIQYREENRFVKNNYSQLYSKFYTDTKIEEEKRGNLETFSREYNYGILINESYNKVNEKEEVRKITKFENNILTITEDNRETKYYLNGNKKYESIDYNDENGILHNEVRYFDESEKLISERIYLNNELKKDYEDKNYIEKIKDNDTYTIKYPNGKIAYEKIITSDNKTLEKYFSKDGILTFSGEYYPNLYKKDIKELIDEYGDGIRIKAELPKNIKRYSLDGKLIFESKFDENEKFTKFCKLSYHQNGKIYYDELETIDNTTNIMVRELKRYNDKGNLEYSLKHDNKIKIERTYKNGKLLYEYVLKKENGDLLEEYNIYYNNGKKRVSDEYHTNYKTGRGINYIKKYSLDGTLNYETQNNYQY